MRRRCSQSRRTPDVDVSFIFGGLARRRFRVLFLSHWPLLWFSLCVEYFYWVLPAIFVSVDVVVPFQLLLSTGFSNFSFIFFQAFYREFLFELNRELLGYRTDSTAEVLPVFFTDLKASFMTSIYLTLSLSLSLSLSLFLSLSLSFSLSLSLSLSDFNDKQTGIIEKHIKKYWRKNKAFWEHLVYILVPRRAFYLEFTRSARSCSGRHDVTLIKINMYI